LEVAVSLAHAQERGQREITLDVVEKALQQKALRYDKTGDEHYNLISAFHKSLRGSDPDAAIYWLGRMLEAGEDPLYVARRMVRFASEDVGNADPQALSVAVSAMEAFRFIGPPEGDLALVQAAVYLATAPKSNALYRAYGKVRGAIAETGTLPVPLHIRNAPTKLMKNLGYGKGYKYAHEGSSSREKSQSEHPDFGYWYKEQDYLPDEIKGTRFYQPTKRGHEGEIKKRIGRYKKKSS
jgi:putative ATPase